MDNIIARNTRRGVALGWENWQFTGADSGGERSAVLCSLTGTCRLTAWPRWLHYVINHIQDWRVKCSHGKRN